jgi:TetR/AcrR family transcriptional regulator, ethionamide resistance regulator
MSDTPQGTGRPRGRPRNDAVDRPTSDGILDTAERVFAAKGFANTSLRTLIAESRVSTTAFYSRFDSKDAVLAALLLRLMTSIGEAVLATMPRAKNVAAGFESGVDVLVDALVRHRTIAKVALGEGAGSDPVRETLLSGYRELASLLEDNLTKLKAKGAVDVDDPAALAWALVGALQMQVMRWAVFADLDDDGLRASLRATARALLPR